MQCGRIARMLLRWACLCGAVSASSGCAFNMPIAPKCDAGTTSVVIHIHHWALINYVNAPACPE